MSAKIMFLTKTMNFRPLVGSVTEPCEIKRGRAFFSSALEVVLETTSVDHSTVYVERAVMAPNIAEVDADRQLGRGTTAGYLLRNRVIWSLHGRVHLDDARVELLRVCSKIF